jgi:hypothetical protein
MVMFTEKPLISVSSPEYWERATEAFTHVDQISGRNIAVISNQFLEEGIKKGWFIDRPTGETMLRAEIAQMRRVFKAQRLQITHHFNKEFLKSLFECGQVKTKFEGAGYEWMSVGKLNELKKRTETEDLMGIGQLNPKYAILGKGGGRWEDVQLKIDYGAVSDRVLFTHLDSFTMPTNTVRNMQVNINGALKSKALFNLKARFCSTAKTDDNHYT